MAFLCQALAFNIFIFFRRNVLTWQVQQTTFWNIEELSSILTLFCLSNTYVKWFGINCLQCGPWCFVVHVFVQKIIKHVLKWQYRDGSIIFFSKKNKQFKVKVFLNAMTIYPTLRYVFFYFTIIIWLYFAALAWESRLSSLHPRLPRPPTATAAAASSSLNRPLPLQPGPHLLSS